MCISTVPTSVILTDMSSNKATYDAVYLRPPRESWRSCEGANLTDIEIRPWPGEDDIAGFGAPCAVSTPKDAYLRMVDAAAESARLRQGKTVLCRTICGSFEHFDLRAIAERYFAGFEDMFCFLFHHPESGWWMGASPELLIEDSGDGRTLRSRALAGTRRIDKDAPWDEKNLEEHRLVIDDIIRRARAIAPGMEASAGALTTLRYGNIEHLCTPISLVAPSPSSENLRIVAAALHPTPAVGGMPRDAAMADIARLEAHPRRFYGGTIATAREVYVILRCVNFDSRRWCIYTGSGITGMSDAEAEWLETSDKARPILEVLNPFSKTFSAI